MVRLATMEFQDTMSLTGIPSNNARNKEVLGAEEKGKEQVVRDEEGVQSQRSHEGRFVR